MTSSEEEFDTILTKTYKRMHHYTCAEATLQGLLELWHVPSSNQLSWATGGYMGAIQSGKTTCGLLIGSGCAISLRIGSETGLIPEESDKKRKKAIRAVRKLYRDFVKEFGSSDCKTLCGCDFSKVKDTVQYVATEAWKSTCDVQLKFVMAFCQKMAEKGRI